MIIKQLIMHNFGIYAGTNVMEFTNKKPIVLIGGLNGRGKTTFLEAVLLSLYGENSTAYKESRYKTFGQYLRAHSNLNDQTGDAYVEMTFSMDQKNFETYTIRRSWNVLVRGVRESVEVHQDDIVSSFLTNNWSMFIENILPCALSSFFFFDGEKIADLAVDMSSDRLKESIRSMLGITVLDTLKNDLTRNQKRREKNDTRQKSEQGLQALRDQKEYAEKELQCVEAELKVASDKVTQKAENLSKLKQNYQAKGGAVIEKKQEMLAKRSQLQAEIEHLTTEELDIASGVLPLLLVRDLITEIKMKAQDEHNDAVMEQASEQISELCHRFSQSNPQHAEAYAEFTEYICNSMTSESDDTVYDLSDHALFQVGDLLEHKLSESLEEKEDIQRQKKFLTIQLNELDSYLSLDINEKELSRLFASIQKEETELVELKARQGTLDNKRATANRNVMLANSEFNRRIEEYLKNVEAMDDADRMTRYTTIALSILDKYSSTLQQRKTDILGDTITHCYHKLSNKKNMIQKIVMNAESLELKYLDASDNKVNKDSLSAGEKQLMVISILWALAICSKKKLPVIIDTPLSRLDSMHRTALIKTYFPKASDQTIILSTDSEINAEHYQMMKKNIGDEFTLVYSEDTHCTTIIPGYFQEVG